MINSKWNNSGPENGLDAMINAIKYYKAVDKGEKRENKFIISSIVEYNVVDCKVLWEIVNYLRNNNCG